MVDTDFGGAISFRHSVMDGIGTRNNKSDEDLDIEMTAFEKLAVDQASLPDTDSDTNDKGARLRSKINSKSSVVFSMNSNRMTRENSAGKALNGFNTNMNKYVIDDDDEDVTK